MDENFMFFAGLFLVIFIILPFVTVLAYIAYIRTIYSHIPRPRPCHFLLGHLPLIQKAAKKGPVSHQFTEWINELGPVFVLHFLLKTTIICSDSTVIKELLTRSKYLKSPDQYQSFMSLYGSRAFGHGLVSEMNHEVWMKKRALFNPAFHRKYLIGLVDQFNNCSDKLVKHLMTLADGETEVTMVDEFGRTTMEIIGKVGFGIEDDIIGNRDNPLMVLLTKMLFGMLSVYRYPLLKYSILPKDVQYRREVREAADGIRAFGRQCILERMELLKRGGEAPQDILTFILQESHNLEGIKDFNLEDMVDEFVTFYGAGQETTANLLSFALLHLGRNPDVMKKLQEEVDTVLERKSFVEYADINKMQYLTLVLKEALRINPPVGILNRLLPHEMDMCGYKIPKGSIILLPVYGMGRNEKHFKNPDTFDPERFTRNEDSPLFAYMPFSLGPRSCIGQTFAMIESKVILCKLIQHLEFKLVPGQSLDFTEAVTNKHKDGCKNYITVRNV